MSVKRRHLISVVIVVLVVNATITLANRAIMNPMHPIDMQISDEPSPMNMKAESRAPLSTSEVMELLMDNGSDDDMKGITNSSAKNTGQLPPEAPRMDCSKITMQMFQVLLQNPDSVEPEDYSCGLLNFISHFEKSNGHMRTLEASLHTAAATIKNLESSLEAEMSKSQFLMKELNETLHRETERAIKAENVIARRVLSEKSRVDTIQKNMTEVIGTSLEQLKEFEVVVKQLEQRSMDKAPTTPYHPAMALMPPPPLQPVSNVSDEDIKKIEVKLESLQKFIQDLTNRIDNMEDGSGDHVNKGIAQIFKTYASLANEIEKEADRAKGEEVTLKTFINNEIAALGKQITSLQDRVTEEKNRVQVIENRRTTDLFEEINRAKTEETRLAQKLKEEMSKAASAFKRLELHVDTQLNSTKGFDDELKSFAANATRRVVEAEEKLVEQILVERTRALQVENTLKMHVDSEAQRAMSTENELRSLYSEEKERAKTTVKELKAALDVEIIRAKGAELTLTDQITAETERAKQEEYQLQENMSTNMSRLLTDMIKEFTRAQSVEMELSDKILQEANRATSAELSLRENLNSEFSRATSKEQELLGLIKKQESSTKVLDQVKDMIESETIRAKSVEGTLENQIRDEVSRAKENEGKLLVSVGEELERFKGVETNLTQTGADVLRATRELELEVRKTVMAEVARAVDAENSLKQQIFSESERARGAELALSLSQIGNYTDVSTRMQDLMKEIEKDSLRLEDISLQISRNLTGDILTLAELFDDKLDDLERSENVRLKKIEDDMKKCCSGSSWRWRNSKGKSVSGSAAGSVINKIMQVFGGSSEDEQEVVASPATSKKADTTKNSGISKTKDSSKGRSFGDSPDYSVDDESDDSSKSVPVAKQAVGKSVNNSKSLTKTTVDLKSANETVVYIHAQKVEDAEQELPEKVSPKLRPLRSSRRVNGNSISKNLLVSVQSANSKVTSRFG